MQANLTHLERTTLSQIHQQAHAYHWSTLIVDVVELMPILTPEIPVTHSECKKTISNLISSDWLQVVSPSTVDDVRRALLSAPSITPTWFRYPEERTIDFTVESGRRADREFYLEDLKSSQDIEFGWAERVSRNATDDAYIEDFVVFATSESWARERIATLYGMGELQSLGKAGYIRQKWCQERRRGVLFKGLRVVPYPADVAVEADIRGVLSRIRQGSLRDWRRLNGYLHFLSGKYDRALKAVAKSEWTKDFTEDAWKQLFSNKLNDMRPSSEA